MKIGVVSRTFYVLPLWVGLEQGLFRDAGLDVSVQYTGHTPPADLLHSGDLQLAVTPPEGVVQDVQRGGRQAIFAGNAGRLSHALITRNGIGSVEQLRGKRLGILSFTEGSFFHFRQMMAKHGMHYPADYSVVCTGGAPDRHRLLQTGEIDAALQSFPWVEMAELAGFNRLCDISEYIPDWQFVTYNGDREWAAAHATELTTFLRALLAATDRVYTDRTGAVAVLARELGIPAEQAMVGWDYFTQTNSLTRDLAINRSGLAAVLAVQIEAGLTPNATPGALDGYLALQYLDAARRPAGA